MSFVSLGGRGIRCGAMCGLGEGVSLSSEGVASLSDPCRWRAEPPTLQGQPNGKVSTSACRDSPPSWFAWRQEGWELRFSR